MSFFFFQAHSAENVAKAIALLKASGYAAPASILETINNDTYNSWYCSVKLPPVQPLSHIDSQVDERLFIICTPSWPSVSILQDIFCRFGNLIVVYIIAGKTCGYAKFSNKDSANRAKEALHCQEICGNRLKVILAEPQDAGRKRRKFDD